MVIVSLVCEGCGKEYNAQDWRHSKYCSKKCAGKNNINKGRFVKGYKYEDVFGDALENVLRKKSILQRNFMLKAHKENPYFNNRKGVKIGEEHKKKIGLANAIALKGRKLSKEHIRKILRRSDISSLEKKMLDIINKNNLPYRFVGNGDFFIERKCPDFINTNGEKIAVEVFYKRHKEMFKKNGLESWKQDRKEIFGKYGWDVKFFNEIEVNEKNILKQLRGV